MKLTQMNKEQDNNIFNYTKRISIELSNLCNYASLHKKCPLDYEIDKKILHKNVVYHVIDQMYKYNFKGTLAFHTYNEPLIDPRLFMFIQYAKDKCRNNIEIMIMTNGYYLNQIMIEELEEVGVSSLYVTAYSAKEYERLKNLHTKIPYIITEGNLDERLNLYEKCVEIENVNTKPCYAPLNEIIIKSDGTVGLCCLDWKNKYHFGNLKENSLDEIIINSNMRDMYYKLAKGIREEAICKVCGWSR